MERCSGGGVKRRVVSGLLNGNGRRSRLNAVRDAAGRSGTRGVVVGRFAELRDCPDGGARQDFRMTRSLRNAPAGERPVRERREVFERHVARADAAPESPAVPFDDLGAVSEPLADGVRIPVLRCPIHAHDAALEERFGADVAREVSQVEDRRAARVQVEQRCTSW